MNSTRIGSLRSMPASGLFGLRIIVALSLLSMACSRTAVADELFDFEGQTAGGATAISEASGGVNVDIGLGGESFDIYDSTSGNHPSSWGLISFFANTTTTKFVANFAGQDVFGVTIDSGDYNADADDIFVEAYSGPGGTGTLLGTDSASIADTDDLSNGNANEFATLAYHGNQTIGSIVFWGEGHLGEHNIFFDNLLVRTTAVPEPSTIALAAAAVFGVAGLRRR